MKLFQKGMHEIYQKEKIYLVINRKLLNILPNKSLQNSLFKKKEDSGIHNNLLSLEMVAKIFHMLKLNKLQHRVCLTWE